MLLELLDDEIELMQRGEEVALESVVALIDRAEHVSEHAAVQPSVRAMPKRSDAAKGVVCFTPPCLKHQTAVLAVDLLQLKRFVNQSLKFGNERGVVKGFGLCGTHMDAELTTNLQRAFCPRVAT